MRWQKMNLDLKKLSVLIEDFFKIRGFVVKAVKLNGAYKIIAIPRKVHQIIGNISVIIEGTADDFCVRLVPSSFSRVLIFLGSVFSFLGFGFLTSKGYKSEENFERLQKDFRKFVAEKVWEIGSHS